MDETLPDEARSAALSHVLREVHPDRLEAEVVEAVPEGDRWLVGVKAHPRGYLSSAKYALVTVDDGAVVDSEACTGGELRERIEQAKGA